MKNKLLMFSIGLVFMIIFIIFYKGLQNTNIYTPESKISYEIPLVSVELFNSNEIVSTKEIFNSTWSCSNFLGSCSCFSRTICVSWK